MDIIPGELENDSVWVDLDTANVVLFLAKVNNRFGYLCLFGAPDLFKEEPLSWQAISYLRLAMGREGAFVEIFNRTFDFNTERTFKITTAKGTSIIRAASSGRPCTHEGVIMDRVYRNYFSFPP